MIRETIPHDEIVKFNYSQLWAQVLHQYREYIKLDSGFWRLSALEHSELGSRNSEFEKLIKGEDEVIDIFEDAKAHPEKWKYIYVTVGEWMRIDTDDSPAFRGLRNYSVNQIGAVLRKHNVPSKTKINGVRNRWKLLPVPSGYYHYKDYDD